MTMQQSFAQIKVIINGHEFEGWADEDPPYEFDFEESSTRSIGRDGGLYALGEPMFGGQWTFKMQASSVTAQWAVQNEQTRKDAHRDGTPLRTYAGTIADIPNQLNYRLEGGVIVMFPAVIIPNQTYEGSIYFESITSNVDAGRFRAPLAPAIPAFGSFEVGGVPI